MRTRIKICGITSEADIEILNRFMPDYTGFVFADSRRKVSAETVKRLIEGLDPAIKRAGVFVDMDAERLCETAQAAGLDIIQLHGDEGNDYIERLRTRLDDKIQIWKAVRVSTESTLVEMKEYRADLYLADAYVKGHHGGTGRSFDWNLMNKPGDRSKIMLAGGLTPENVRRAISIARPFGVDVSSGVEADGKKDARLVEEFVARVREMEG